MKKRHKGAPIWLAVDWQFHGWFHALYKTKISQCIPFFSNLSLLKFLDFVQYPQYKNHKYTCTCDKSLTNVSLPTEPSPFLTADMRAWLDSMSNDDVKRWMLKDCR